MSKVHRSGKVVDKGLHGTKNPTKHLSGRSFVAVSSAPQCNALSRLELLSCEQQDLMRIAAAYALCSVAPFPALV